MVKSRQFSHLKKRLTNHLAKGLEFDNVIVPYATKKNYFTEPDRQMLYVACTRAMHKPSLTHTEAKSHFFGRQKC